MLRHAGRIDWADVRGLPLPFASLQILISTICGQISCWTLQLPINSKVDAVVTR